MCDFNLAFYFISLAILCTYTFCNGATHWIVTEDGRIQRQADSIFNLKSPYDLVTFIRQQNAFERLQILREEYLIEKRKVIEARKKERKVIQKSFYKVDPDCINAGKHIAEFELHLDMTLPFTKKGINIPDHVNLCEPLPSHFDPPICRAGLPTVMYSYDHLEGINGRHQLNTSMEPTLLSSLSSYFKTVDELGGRVSLALEKNSSSFVLLNLAASYWRIKGNALEAVECLRQALYFSPREHKDRALMGLAAVLYHANHSHDSLVLLHTAVDSYSELSVYHFLLGNIYASLKMYEMAELCYRFTMVISPDTELLCERIKAVRCELKIKEMLEERQLAYDEMLDSLKTPELDETKEPNEDEAEKKHFLPLEIYKQQLNRVFSLHTRGRTKYTDVCKSRTVAAPEKQESRLSSDHAEANKKRISQVSWKEESETSSDSQQDSKHQTTENTSPRVQSTSQEKQIKAVPHSQITQKYGDKNGEESVKSSRIKGTKEGEALKATSSASDKKNASAEEKTMQNLAEARLALNRLKSIIQTVSHAHGSASSTVDSTENKGSRSDSGVDSKNNGKQTIPDQSKSSFIKSTPTVGEKESQVKKVGNPARMSRRGDSGFKILKSNPLSREDNAKAVTTEETKFYRQKGESILMSKNGPGFKLDNIASKNTREISNADLLFEEPKGSRPVGPKHTPPLESKHVLTRAKICGNLEGKKRKGEAFAKECATKDPNTQSFSAESNKQSVGTTEFSKAATKITDTETLSDAEAKLMKQTSAGEVSTTASSNINISDRTAEAKVVEKPELKTSGAKNVENSETGNVKTESGMVSKNSDAKLAEQGELKTTVKGVDGSNSLKQHSDAKGAVKSEAEVSFESKTSGAESEDLKENSRGSTSGREHSHDKQSTKSDAKTPTTMDVKNKSSDNESGDLKQPGRATTSDGKSPEKANKGQKAAPKINPEQKNTELKSKKVFNSDGASHSIKEKVKEAEYLYKVGAGSSVFETSFLNVPTSGSLQELSDEECKHIEGIQALVIRNKQFSAWLSLDTKNIDVRAHIDFLSEVDDLLKTPRCTAKVKSNLHTFGNLQSVMNADELDQVAEVGLTQTLLTIGRTMQDSVEEMGTRIYNALKKNSTSWVLLNIASLYWRVQGDTVEAIKCLRQALSFSPANTRDVAHVGLASILLREDQLEDATVVIKKALEISPSLALGHFILGSVFGAQSNIPDSIQHYLLALQLEPSFTPAVERLKIIQCVLWKQQKALEKEAEDLKKLLTPN